MFPAHRRRGILASRVTLMVSLTGPIAAAERGYPFQDPDLALSMRVDDLLRRLTLDEKTTDRNNNGAVVTANATVFPQSVGLASTWDTALVERVGEHYLANNNEIRRDTTSSNLRPRMLREYDELAFKPAISADAATGVMGAYNLVNGRPNSTGDKYVNTTTSARLTGDHGRHDEYLVFTSDLRINTFSLR